MGNKKAKATLESVVGWDKNVVIRGSVKLRHFAF